MTHTTQKLFRTTPKLTFEQYKVLLSRKKHAHANSKRVRYKDLVKEWGVQEHCMATAVHRGIKQYDYILWKQSEL